MTVELDTGWNLRSVMASRGIFQTSKLKPLLEERGIDLSREQVYRLVTQPPQRVRLDVLAALCDALECSLDDLVTITRRQDSTPVAVGEEATTVEEVCEPFLVRAGMIARTPRGRVATALAWTHLGMVPPAGAGGLGVLVVDHRSTESRCQVGHRTFTLV